jgi:hypothetical protein
MEATRAVTVPRLTVIGRTVFPNPATVTMTLSEMSCIREQILCAHA